MKGVSVIVCCYNAANRITPTLTHLQQQVFKYSINWEVIVVDNASTDQTGKISKEIWDMNPVTTINITREEKAGLTYARKNGLLHARYDIVSFIDDDNWVENLWVQKVYDLFDQDNRIGACGGRNEAVFEGKSPDWFPLFQNSFAVGKQAEKSGILNNGQDYLWGAGASFRKSVWEELQKRRFVNLTSDRQGKTLSSGGDTELCYAIRLMGYQLYYEDKLILKHYMPISRLQFSYLEKLQEGFGRANVKLNCYRVLLYPGTFKLFPWWYEFAAASKKMIKSSFSILSGNRERKWEAKVEKAYWKGYALQMWKDRNSLKRYISDLKHVFAD